MVVCPGHSPLPRARTRTGISMNTNVGFLGRAGTRPRTYTHIGTRTHTRKYSYVYQ